MRWGVGDQRARWYGAHVPGSAPKDRSDLFGSSQWVRERLARRARRARATSRRRDRDPVNDPALLGLESDVVLGGESTSARSASMAMDWFALGRTRTLPEIIEELRGITLSQINDYLGRRASGTPTIVTMGPAPLDC